MAKAVATDKTQENAAEEVALRVYEAGYQISPSVKEEDLEKVVADIRAAVEKAGGSFIAEGAPAMNRLAYAIETKEGGKRMNHDRAYFGWLKFEAATSTVEALNEALNVHPLIIRSLVFKTVREDTRAKMKAPTLREVKRTDTIKTSPRRAADETKGPVSEVDLDKALETITAE